VTIRWRINGDGYVIIERKAKQGTRKIKCGCSVFGMYFLQPCIPGNRTSGGSGL